MIQSTNKRFTTLAAIALSLGLGAGLAGCASEPATTTNTSATDQGSEQSDAQTQDAVTFERAWGKATDQSMTGVFGSLVNHTDADITLVSADSPVADLVELHETVMIDGQMKMREIEGGFLIKAGETRELNPGEDHIMLMKLNRALLPGEVLPISLTFSDGSTLELELDIREFAGANEEYADLDHHGDMHGDMDHEMDHEEH